MPKVLSRSISASSRFFKVEQLQLLFNNGQQRQYERLVGSGQDAVMAIPVTEQQELLLVREYAAGTHSYELGFPKGLAELNEAPEQALNRELQEEIGYKAAHINKLSSLSLAPSYFSSIMHIYVACSLSPSQLEGDEPEPLELIKVPISDSMSLLERADFCEARSVAALLLFHRWWQQQG